MNYVIVIPNRYPDIIQPLLESLKKYEAGARVLIVAHEHEDGYGHNVIHYPDKLKWCYAKAANLGIEWAQKWTDKPDVVLLNDDCTLTSVLPFVQLGIQAGFVNPVGLISPLIKGCAGNRFQRWHEKPKWWRPYETMKLVWDPDTVCFPCVYIKNEAINQCGLLDEDIPGYGGEDFEYCKRMRSIGWWTAVSSLVTVQHGDGSAALESGRGKSWSLSFARQ